MMRRSNLLLLRLALFLILALPLPVAAQSYPNHTIKIIVRTGVGGITDILARLVAKSMSDQLGQPVIIDNRSGAGGIVGTRIAAQADPDGYTLLMVFPSHAANPALYANLPYDSEKDFAPVSMVTRVSEILLVPPSSLRRTSRNSSSSFDRGNSTMGRSASAAWRIWRPNSFSRWPA
jgi:tripartite-type tricarboxylate transporter receptor subunit TctC